MDIKRVEPRKPVYEAVRVSAENAKEVREWCGQSGVKTREMNCLFILRNIGRQYVYEGDWIVKRNGVPEVIRDEDYRWAFTEVAFGNDRPAETVHFAKPGAQWDSDNFETFGER